MWIKIIVVVLLIAIVISLFRAMNYMLKAKGQGDERKMARMLAWRVSLTALLFVILVLSMWMGWVTPHGVRPPSFSAQSHAQPQSQTQPQAQSATSNIPSQTGRSTQHPQSANTK